MVQVFVILLSIVNHGISQSCTYADIDLTSLANTFVDCPYTTSYTLQYQACGNNVVCECEECPYSGNSYLAMMIDATQGNSCYWLASESDTVVGESLTVNGIDAYRLSYDNGIQIPCEAPRKLNLTFVCDPLVYNSQLTRCSEPIPCNYDLQIHTSAACGSTTVCSYTTQNGYSIDLTSLNGLIFGSPDTNNPFNYLYGYTPCRNGYVCNQNFEGTNKYIRQDIVKYGHSKLKNNIPINTIENVMLYRDDVRTFTCDKILGYFDNTVPDYNTDEQYFEFIYQVPDQCDGEPSVTFVKWYCNPSVLTANITYATNITTCGYEIKIDSRLAC